MSVKNKPQIEAFIGASGSGKGVSILRRLKELKPARLIIWDPRSEYAGQATSVKTLPALVKAVGEAGAGPFRLRYVAGPALKLPDAFGLVCRLAFEVGDVVFVAEELSDITTASHAPASWRQCITQGRHKGLHIIGAAQRPALIDKTFLGNCTFIRCFTLRYRNDRQAMAQSMDVPEAQISELQTDDDGRKVRIRYLERDFRAGYTQGGTINLSR